MFDKESDDHVIYFGAVPVSPRLTILLICGFHFLCKKLYILIISQSFYKFRIS